MVEEEGWVGPSLPLLCLLLRSREKRERKKQMGALCFVATAAAYEGGGVMEFLFNYSALGLSVNSFMSRSFVCSIRSLVCVSDSFRACVSAALSLSVDAVLDLLLLLIDRRGAA